MGRTIRNRTRGKLQYKTQMARAPTGSARAKECLSAFAYFARSTLLKKYASSMAAFSGESLP
jgi:hypothetical protein